MVHISGSGVGIAGGSQRKAVTKDLSLGLNSISS